MKLFGIVGWSGAGKTTLIEKLIPIIRAQGFSVSTIKHAHHGFDIDRPGKDSFRHRAAGATEVLIASAQRWVILHETHDAVEPSLDELVARLAPVDLVLIEGFKAHPHPKIEVYRTILSEAPCSLDDPTVIALVSDRPQDDREDRHSGRVFLDLNQPREVAKFILENSRIPAIVR